MGVDRVRRGWVVGSLRSAFVVAVGSLATFASGPEQARFSEDGLWQILDAVPQRAARAEPWVQPDRFKAVALDHDRLNLMLPAAPMEFTAAARQSPLIFTLPMPDGTFARFAVEESPIMAPELAAKFPEIKTYRGRGIDDVYASLRFDITPQGFHSQVLSPHGAAYIDPYWRNDTSFYACYYKRDYRAGARPFTCHTESEAAAQQPLEEFGSTAGGAPQVLRNYRLACAATGEYTAFHGGTVATGLAAIVVAINRVSGIYELETASSMTLVGNNNLIVYTNGATDPYSNSDGGAMLGQNQSNLTNVIGSPNYDVGHVFSTGGGGVANLQVVCKSASKARGVTGLPQPVGDPFYVDYVAHEMGHQYGGNHNFNGINGSCGGGNRNGSTAYEPGSGSTIMGYAGICGADNLQPNSDPYFEFISVQEIRAYLTTGFGNTCPTIIDGGNNSPTVDAGPDYTIPGRTTFLLNANGSDPDGDPVTYCWEERDLGPAQALSAPDNGSSPIFRTFNPKTDSFRFFPRLANILNNTNSLGEKLPTTNRLLRFRVTARDNRPDGGGVAFDDMQLTVNNTGSAFEVLQPAPGVIWSGGRTVTWQVGQTASSPINVSEVNILLSTDGGLTFPTVLVSNVPNDGSQLVTMPDINTTTARVKVEPVGNVFFSISDGNFTIQPCPAAELPLAEVSAVAKNRYLTFQPNNSGVQAAFRVTLTDLPPAFEALEGEVRWLGPPQTAPSVPTAIRVSKLQCTPYFSDWLGISHINVYGAEVVPQAIYDVQATNCGTEEEDFSDALSIPTGTWGDVAAPFGAPGSGQPNFGDVTEEVTAFIGSASAIGKARSQLQPNEPNPQGAISFADISRCVEAFSGSAYPYAGPGTCP